MYLGLLWNVFTTSTGELESDSKEVYDCFVGFSHF